MREALAVPMVRLCNAYNEQRLITNEAEENIIPVLAPVKHLNREKQKEMPPPPSEEKGRCVRSLLADLPFVRIAWSRGAFDQTDGRIATSCRGVQIPGKVEEALVAAHSRLSHSNHRAENRQPRRDKPNHKSEYRKSLLHSAAAST